MQAINMYKVKDLRIESVEKPSPEEDEVLIKVMAVGVCGSDIPRINKKGAHTSPIIPGHEFAGEIVELGKRIQDYKIGDHVSVAPLMPCYTCKWCQEGEYGLCEDYLYYGSRNDGAFAEYIAVKSANVVKIADDLPFDWGALMDPLANAIHVFIRGEVTKNDTLTIFGMGAIGLLAIQYAKYLGIKKVIAVDIQDGKLISAKENGADHVVNSSKENVNEKINDYTNGHGTSAVFEISGSSIAQIQAVQAARKMGRIVFHGISNEDLNIPNKVLDYILRGQLTLKGSWNSFSEPFPGNEWSTAADLLNTRQIDASKLITHKYGLNGIPKVFERIDTEEFFFNKIMFYPNNKK